MAKANKLWTFVGITSHNGSSKVRFGVDRIRRVKQFSKGGATRIDLVDLPQEMSKLDALTFLKAHSDFQSPEDQCVIAEAYDYRAKVASRAAGEVKVRVPRVKKDKPSLDAIKSRSRKVVETEVSVEEVIQAATEGAVGTDPVAAE